MNRGLGLPPGLDLKGELVFHNNVAPTDLVKKFKDYPWASHPGCLSESKAWVWLHKEPVLPQFAHTPSTARYPCRQYMAQDGEEEIEQIFSLKKLPGVLGSKEPIQKVKEGWFGIWKDNDSTCDVNSYVRNLRKGSF